jgi:hypothetical protein
MPSSNVVPSSDITTTDWTTTGSNFWGVLSASGGAGDGTHYITQASGTGGTNNYIGACTFNTGTITAISGATYTAKWQATSKATSDFLLKIYDSTGATLLASMSSKITTTSGSEITSGPTALTINNSTPSLWNNFRVVVETAMGGDSSGNYFGLLITVTYTTSGTPVSLADTGSGSDTTSIVWQQSFADSSTGADAAPTLNLPLADATSANDGPEVYVWNGLLYVGVGTYPLVSVSYPDSGAAADVFPVLDSLATDTSSGTEVASIALSVTDTGSSTETEFDLQLSFGIDTGSATDAFPLVDSLAIDVGLGTESLSGSILLSDVMTANDGESTIATFMDTDTGTGTETTFFGGLAQFDTGSGLDTLTAVPINVYSESSVGLDAMSVGVGNEWADASSGADVAGQELPISLVDSIAAVGVDVLGLTAFVPFVDTLTGTDSLGTVITYSLTDAGVGSDNILQATIIDSVTDTGTGADSFFLASFVTADLKTMYPVPIYNNHAPASIWIEDLPWVSLQEDALALISNDALVNTGAVR